MRRSRRGRLRRGVIVAAGALLVALHAATAEGASIGRLCRDSCKDEVDVCVAGGGSKRDCRREVLQSCRTDGLATCLSGDERRARANTAKLPAAPSGLTATTISSAEISLTWIDGGQSEVSQEVERSTAPLDGFGAIATLKRNVVTFTDRGLPEGTTFYYRVRVFSRKGASSVSNVASATTAPAGGDPHSTTTTTTAPPTTTTLPADTTPPSVPAGLSATVMSCGRIDLAWNASVDAGGSGLKGYNVYGWLNGAWAFRKQVAAPGTSTAETGLAASTTYFYALTAVDNAGNTSGMTTWVAGATPSCVTTTTAPPVTTSSTSTTIRPTTTSTSSSTSTTSSTSTSTRPTTTSTTSSSSTSTTTSTSTSTTTLLVDTTPPAPPANPSTRALSCSEIEVAWGASSDAGGSGLAAYRVYRNGAFLKQVPAPATSAGDTGLAPSTIYTHQVSAVDNAGNESARSATATTNTPACGTGGTSGAHLWSRGLGGASFTDAVVPYAVTADGAGNVVVTGTFYGTVDFGTGRLTSAGAGDMFLAKYSPAGVSQWVHRFGVAENQFGTAVGTDASGNVYVTGYFFGTVDFGGGALASAGSYDVVVAKYTASGAHVWSRRFGGTGFELTQALAVDGQGNVLVGGHFAGTADFGGAAFTSVGSNDGFVAKYSPTGTHVWSRRVGGADLDTVTGLGVDGAGNPTIVGYFAGTASFGGANLTSAGSNDVFVARYSAAGAHQWSSRFGDAQDQRAYGAAVDAAGNVALTGYFYGTMDFGGPAMALTGISADIFLAKLDASGAHVWSKAFGTTLNSGEVGQAVAFDANGSVVLTGEINRPVDFGGGALTAAASYDAFVAKFSAAGAHQWSKRFVAKWDDHGSAVAVDGSGNLILTGDFYEAVNFGGDTLTSPGSTDGFIVKLAP
jgi:hypothetical protein